VRNALTLARRTRGFVPGHRLADAGFVERQSRVVAEAHAAALRQIFVEDACPFTLEIDLREGRRPGRTCEEQHARRRDAKKVRDQLHGGRWYVRPTSK
jgi:hypothetical protein